jgi:hypothetical protein
VTYAADHYEAKRMLWWSQRLQEVVAEMNALADDIEVR